MLLENSGTIYENEHNQIDSELSYSSSLEAAMNLILKHPAFTGDKATPFVQVH